MEKKSIKGNLIGIFLTVLVITMTALSGPVRAIEVNMSTPDIDVSTDSTQTFTLEIQVKDGEFLPIRSTDLTFTAKSQDTLCTINSDNSISNCNFLTVASREITGLTEGKDFGYGYGYGNNHLGWQDFGYGYGYGYGTRGAITGNSGGLITYTLEVNTALLPSNFIDSDSQVRVVAKVYGGDETDLAYFTGGSGFYVFQSAATADEAEVLGTKNALKNSLILNGNVNINNVVANLYLPTSLTGSKAAISWSSSNSAVISTAGAVTRPASNSIDASVTLTATIQKGVYSKTKIFELTVKKKKDAAIVNSSTGKD